MEIKLGRYRTRDGREAVVTEIFEYQAFGRIHNYGSIWEPCSWVLALGGSFRADGPNNLDLIAPWEEPKSRPRVCLCPSGALYLLLERDAVALGYVLVPELDALFEKGKE